MMILMEVNDGGVVVGGLLLEPGHGHGGHCLVGVSFSFLQEVTKGSVLPGFYGARMPKSENLGAKRCQNF